MSTSFSESKMLKLKITAEALVSLGMIAPFDLFIVITDGPPVTLLGNISGYVTSK